MNITDLLHLKTSLKTDGIINSSSDKENILGIGLFGSKPLQSFLILKNSLDFLRECLQFFYIGITLFFCDLTSDLRKLECQHIGCDQLCTVSLRGRNRNLRTCKCIKYIVCLSCNRRTDNIHNSKCTDPSGFTFAECRKAVCCLTGLTDNDRKAVFVQDRITISKF